MDDTSDLEIRVVGKACYCFCVLIGNQARIYNFICTVGHKYTGHKRLMGFS